MGIRLLSGVLWLAAAGGLLSFPAWADPGYEPYSVRPDALKLQPKAHPDLGRDWDKLKRGHLEVIAQLVEMYPDREIYFLARDSELLFDLAREVTRPEPAAQVRIHLLNVSRANMRDPHLREYLAQEGISEATLKAGKKILFVDTGFSGTIPRVISESFPPELRSQLQTHLLSSSNPAHPSSRVFLTSINPAAASLNPASLHGSIVGYEHMPRFTDRSDRYQRVGDRWEAMSRAGGSTDGSVSPQKARAYQEDLLAYAQLPEARQLLVKRREQWKKLRLLSQSSQLTSEQLVVELKAMLAEDPTQVSWSEAIVRDFLELRATNLPGGPPQVTPQALGLNPALSTTGGSNKNALIKKHPEWASILENPETEIPKLIQSAEWGKLGALSDAVKDVEFTTLLTKSLGAAAPTPMLRHFLEMLIEKGDARTLHDLARYTFSQPHTAEMKDLIRLLIEKGDTGTLHDLAMDTFSKPHTAEMKDLIRLLIEKGDAKTLHNLAMYTFSRPHTAEMKDLIRLLIEKGDTGTLQYLATDTFSQPHAAEMKDLIRQLIEKGGAETLHDLARYTFSQPHAAGMMDLIRLLIEKGDAETLQYLATDTFSQPHTAEMKDLIRQLIEKGDARTLYHLAKYTFSQPHTAGMRDLMRQLIEKGDARTLQHLGETFSLRFWDTPDNQVLIQARSIADSSQRRQFLEQHLGTEAPSLPQPVKTGSFSKIDSKLQTGDLIRSASGRQLVVESFIDEGKRGRVYRVLESASGTRYALKVARDTQTETLESLAQESTKAQAYQKLGLKHAAVVESQPTYVLKSWIEGKRVDAWIKNWEAKGSPQNDPALARLQALVQISASQGAYVGDLNAKNLLWDGTDWVIIDSGGIREGLSHGDAFKNYLEKLPKRWAKSTANPGATGSCLLQVLQAVTVDFGK